MFNWAFLSFSLGLGAWTLMNASRTCLKTISAPLRAQDKPPKLGCSSSVRLLASAGLPGKSTEKRKIKQYKLHWEFLYKTALLSFWGITTFRKHWSRSSFSNLAAEIVLLHNKTTVQKVKTELHFCLWRLFDFGSYSVHGSDPNPVRQVPKHSGSDIAADLSSVVQGAFSLHIFL